MTAWALFSALKRVPVRAWAALALVAVLGAVYGLRVRAVSSAFQRGKQHATQGVTFDSAMQARAAEAVALRAAKTDTVWLRAKTATKKAEAAITALPPDLAVLPPVDTLVQTVGVLLTQVDTLTTAITAERFAHLERAKVDSAAIYALRVIGTAQRDTIHDLRKRPTRKRAALYALLGVGAGFLGGLAR